VIEEAHELVDAIDDGDLDHLAEELGDLLLQVALHAQIAEESGAFTIEDVYDHVNRKLVRRHPHVFGDVTASTSDRVVQTWDSVKAEERRLRGVTVQPQPGSPFDSLPRSMPVLTRIAQTLGNNQPIATVDAGEQAGQQLLHAVEAVIAAGLDPERELELAFRIKAALQTN